MKILTSEDQAAGWVAAVVLANDSQTVTHLLLARPPARPTYRLVPVTCIEEVSAATIRLSISSQTLETLPGR